MHAPISPAKEIFKVQVARILKNEKANKYYRGLRETAE